MKQHFLTLMILISTVIMVVGQQVPRDQVVIEMGTATW